MDYINYIHYSTLFVENYTGSQNQIRSVRASTLKPITITEVDGLQNQLNLSDNKIHKALKILRQNNKDNVEPNIDRQMMKMENPIEKYFAVETIDYVKEHSTAVMSQTVYCTNIPELLDVIIEKRGYDKTKLFIKIGADGGGGFIKICCSICFYNPEDENKTNRIYKSGGVKKLIILLLAANVEENHSNMKLINEKLKLDMITELTPYKVIISSDLKMANIMVGLMSHSSS